MDSGEKTKKNEAEKEIEELEKLWIDALENVRSRAVNARSKVQCLAERLASDVFAAAEF